MTAIVLLWSVKIYDKARIMADQPPLRRPEGNPWGPSILRVICVTIKQSYNRVCVRAGGGGGGGGGEGAERSGLWRSREEAELNN